MHVVVVRIVPGDYDSSSLKEYYQTIFIDRLVFHSDTDVLAQHKKGTELSQERKLQSI